MTQEEYRDPAEKAINHSLDQELEQKPKGKTSRVEEEKPVAWRPCTALHFSESHSSHVAIGLM